jgi:hypothetical protein
MIPFSPGIFSFRYIKLGTTINFAYAGLPRIAWYIPENEGFYAEVLHVPERERQIDLPDGERLDSGYDPVELRSRQPQCGPRDAHLVKR